MKIRIRANSPFVLLLTAAIVAAASLPALAQSTAVLRGTVTDPAGAVIPNATIVVRDQATSLERTTQTDSDGNYQIAALPVGTYRVEAQAKGFQTGALPALVVEVATTLVQNFQLKVGDVSQQVVVTSDAPVIESTTTSVGTVINQRIWIQEIPLNGRHFVDWACWYPAGNAAAERISNGELRGQGSLD